MEYSALISEIAVEAQASPESTYSDLIEQKFFDAVVSLIPTASINYLPSLIESPVKVIASNIITLSDDFMRFVTIEQYVIGNNIRYTEVDADKWKWLGIDTEQDPPAGVAYYYLNGRVIRFYSGSNIAGYKVKVRYIKHPTKWSDYNPDDDMYEKFHATFINEAKKLAITSVINILRGEQNDME